MPPFQHFYPPPSLTSSLSSPGNEYNLVSKVTKCIIFEILYNVHNNNTHTHKKHLSLIPGKIDKKGTINYMVESIMTYCIFKFRDMNNKVEHEIQNKKEKQVI